MFSGVQFLIFLGAALNLHIVSSMFGFLATFKYYKVVVSLARVEWGESIDRRVGFSLGSVAF